MKWVYMAIPVTESLELLSRYVFRTPARAAEALQMAIIGAMLTELEKYPGTDRIHGEVEDLAGELHRLWESGAISSVTITEERLKP